MYRTLFCRNMHTRASHLICTDIDVRLLDCRASVLPHVSKTSSPARPRYVGPARPKVCWHMPVGTRPAVCNTVAGPPPLGPNTLWNRIQQLLQHIHTPECDSVYQGLARGLPDSNICIMSFYMYSSASYLLWLVSILDSARWVYCRYKYLPV